MSAFTGTTIITCSIPAARSRVQCCGLICTYCSGCRYFRSQPGGWEKTIHRSAHCALRASAVDGRNRLPPASGGDHQRARPGINPEEGSRPRLEGQAVAAAVCLSNPCSLTFCLARANDPCDRCTDLVDSGSAYRKTFCELNGRENATACLQRE